jgi:hypothetical protein
MGPSCHLERSEGSRADLNVLESLWEFNPSWKPVDMAAADSIDWANSVTDTSIYTEITDGICVVRCSGRLMSHAIPLKMDANRHQIDPLTMLMVSQLKLNSISSEVHPHSKCPR